MKHQFKDSSSISHIDYHEDKKALEVCFTSGSVYHYPNCDKGHYDKMKSAESPGKYFSMHIRKMKHEKQE